MKFNSFIILFIVLMLSCKAKDTTRDDLKNAMQAYLYKGVNNDSSNIKYHVEDVIYFDDTFKKRYVCEFTVHLKEKLFDTTGKMKAYISKDLKKITRLY